MGLTIADFIGKTLKNAKGNKVFVVGASSLPERFVIEHNYGRCYLVYPSGHLSPGAENFGQFWDVQDVIIPESKRPQAALQRASRRKTGDNCL